MLQLSFKIFDFGSLQCSQYYACAQKSPFEQEMHGAQKHFKCAKFCACAQTLPRDNLGASEFKQISNAESMKIRHFAPDFFSLFQLPITSDSAHPTSCLFLHSERFCCMLFQLSELAVVLEKRTIFHVRDVARAAFRLLVWTLPMDVSRSSV